MSAPEYDKEYNIIPETFFSGYNPNKKYDPYDQYTALGVSHLYSDYPWLRIYEDYGRKKRIAGLENKLCWLVLIHSSIFEKNSEKARLFVHKYWDDFFANPSANERGGKK